MKTFYLLILLNVFAIGLVSAQTKPFSRAQLDSLNARIDSLEKKILQRVESAHGPGAGIGADGPWIQEQKILQQTYSCIQKTDSSQTGLIFGCLEPLRTLYENGRAYRISSVTQLAQTLTKSEFVTKDAKPLALLSFLQQNTNRVREEKDVQEELARKLHWKKEEPDRNLAIRHFVENMTLWEQHLQQDSQHS